MVMETKKEQKYKCLHTRLYEADYEYTLHVDLMHFPHCNESQWSFELFNRDGSAWKGNLQALVEKVLG